MHGVVSDVNTPKILELFEAPTKNALLDMDSRNGTSADRNMKGERTLL